MGSAEARDIPIVTQASTDPSTMPESVQPSTTQAPHDQPGPCKLAVPEQTVTAVADVADTMLSPQLSPASVFVRALTRKVTTKQETEGQRCTPNILRSPDPPASNAFERPLDIRALSVSALLFTAITIAQAFAAVAANSQALLLDCISMGVDAFTYMGNILVECRKRKPGRHVVPQLIVVFCSLGLLCYFTQDALQESWSTIQVCTGNVEAEDGDGDVNGWITLAFALFGVLFDLACMVEFYKSHKLQESVKAVNMFSAFLHVGADFLRSTSTTVMSFIILATDLDSTCVDAYTSAIIGATIIVGALFGFWKWLILLVEFCFGWESKDTVVG